MKGVKKMGMTQYKKKHDDVVALRDFSAVSFSFSH